MLLDTLWEKYQEMIGELDAVIAEQLRAMRRQTELPPLAAQDHGCVAASRTIHASTCAQALYYGDGGGSDGHRRH